MLLINTYGTVTDAPGTSAGSDGSNVSATSAQSVQESSPVAELSDEDLIAKAARVKALKEKLLASSERQKIQLEDIDRVIAADAKHNETRREEFLADCKEYGLDPKTLEQEFDERVQARIETAAREGTLKHPQRII